MVSREGPKKTRSGEVVGDCAKVSDTDQAHQQYDRPGVITDNELESEGDGDPSGLKRYW